MKLESKLEKPDKDRAALSAGTIAISFLVVGFIPLSHYIFFSDLNCTMDNLIDVISY